MATGAPDGPDAEAMRQAVRDAEALVGKWRALEPGSGRAVRPDDVIDLRSDTVTTPTNRMRAAMAVAAVGDDVFGDDPTIWELESRITELLHKESALFVPTGTMGNLVSVMAHCERRDAEVIVGHHSHMCIYEQGGIATVAHCHPRQLLNEDDGTIALAAIEEAIRPVDDHFPTTTLVCVENTHNKKGGLVLPLSYLEELSALLRPKGIRIHMDGARVFAAAAALDVPLHCVVAHADSVTVCLSKALGAPGGSVVAGDAEFIRRCRRARKALGGGMRQAGVLAAAGLVALEETLPKLKEDQRAAQAFARGIAHAEEGSAMHRVLRVDLERVHTNLVYVRVDPTSGAGARKIAEALRQHKVWALALDDKTMRFVFHHQVSTDEAVAASLAALEQAVQGLL